MFSILQPSILHDFAVTANWAIFCDIQIVMQPMKMVLGDGAPVGVDPGKVPRIGILPKYAPGFNPFHTINAWEEGDELVLVAPKCAID